MDILDLNTSFILKSNEFSTIDSNIIDNLKIINYNLIEDNNDNKLLISKIRTDNDKKIYIETDYLKINNIIIENDDIIKLKLESTPELKNLFDYLDEKCKLLLQEFINCNQISNILNNLDDKIEYFSIVNDDTNEFSIYINNSQQIYLSDIKNTNNISIILSIDYISFIVNRLQARTKLYIDSVNIFKNNNQVEAEAEEVEVEEVEVEEVKEVKVEEVKVEEEAEKEEEAVEEVKVEVEAEVKQDNTKIKPNKRQVKQKIEKPKNNKKGLNKQKIEKNKDDVQNKQNVQNKEDDKDDKDDKCEIKEVKKRGRKPTKNIINVNE
jgi:hypothetical protein